MSSPVSVPVSGTAPRPSPGSVPAGAATKMVFPSRKKQDNEEWAKIQARLGMTSRRQSVKA